LIAVVAVAALAAYGIFAPAGPTQEKLVQLKPGSSAHRIAAALANSGIIRSQYAFLLWHYTHGRKPLKAGEYAFDHRANTREVYDRIARGDVYFHTVVVPEGFNMFDIADALEEEGLGKREDFLKVARTETALVRDIDSQAPSLEGYLFPDTYHFNRTQSLHDIAATMVRRFRQAAHEAGLENDFHSIVTMASIVEKETGAPEERPEVAGVFNNRLAKNMVLATSQTCTLIRPTIPTDTQACRPARSAIRGKRHCRRPCILPTPTIYSLSVTTMAIIVLPAPRPSMPSMWRLTAGPWPRR
jgi:UPF0755 protein